jgi:hypothetical protein
VPTFDRESKARKIEDPKTMARKPPPDAAKAIRGMVTLLLNIWSTVELLMFELERNVRKADCTIGARDVR